MAAESVSLHFYIENQTDLPIRWLPWGTPLEERLTADCFDVTVNDQQLDYIGIVVKRMAPTDADYIELAAGDKIEAEVDLSLSYDMAAAGEYTVQLKTVDGVNCVGPDEFHLTTEPLRLTRRNA